MAIVENAKDVKALRKKLGINQSELANLAGVSQSLIAKVESGHIDTSYTNMTKIIRAISAFTEKEGLKARDVMNKKVISLKPAESVMSAVNIMKKHAISQIPIIQNDAVVGIVSETDIITCVASGRGKCKKTSKDIGQIKIEDVMKDAPPIISRTTNISVVSGLLRFFPMVLVAHKGRIEGVITKADILRTLE